jgi:hypothetical protein
LKPQKQPVQINFAKGIDTKTDPWQVGPQSFLAMENAIFQTGGRIGKRNGFASLSTNTINEQTLSLNVIPANVGVGRLVAEYNEELVLCDGINLYSRTNGAGDPGWNYKGRATLASLVQSNINKGINSDSQQDSAQNNTLGWNVFAWVDSVVGLTYDIVDQATGQILLPPVQLSATGVKPRCLSVGGNLYVIWYEPGTNLLKGVIINSLGPVTILTVVTDVNSTAPGGTYDADIINGNIYLAYFTSNGSPKHIKISAISTALVQGNTITKTASAECISIFGDPSNNVWVCYGASTSVVAFVVDPTVTTTVLAQTTVDSTATGTNTYNITGCFSTVTNQAYIFYDQNVSPAQAIQVETGLSDTAVGFVQPAIGSSVNVGLSYIFWSSTLLNSTVFIPTGGFYTISADLGHGWIFSTTGASSATAGAVYHDASGNLFTIVNTVAAGTSFLVTSPSLNPFISPGPQGTLTKTSGTGDATLTVLANSQLEVEAVSLTNLGTAGNATAGSNITATAQGSQFAYEVFSTVQYAWINFNTLTLAGAVGTPTLYANEANLASKAWAYLGIPTLGIVHSAQLQPTYFISNLYNYPNIPSQFLNANLAVKVCESEAGGTPALNILPRVNQQSATAFQIAFLQQDLLFTSTTPSSVTPSISKVNTYANFGVVSDVIDFFLSNPSAVALGENLNIASGTVIQYDGQNVVENNFHIYPENVQISVSQFVTTGSGLSTGQYGYQFVYEWTDNQGQVNRSSPSPVISIAVTAGQAVQISVPFLTLTQKQGSTIVAYRTIANGDIYFRLLPVPATQANILNANPPVWTFTDIAADNTLLANEQIYTTGEVENIGPPAALALFTYKNRLILIPADTPSQIWYSKQVIPGSPVEMSDLFVLNVGTMFGNLTAGARLDDKIILGTETNLLYIVGDGPAASGANNDFSNPIFITADAGIVNQQSIVYSPMGLFFKSLKGIYICGRDLSVEYLGAPAEAFNSQGVVGGQLISNANQVRFMLSGGSTLMYDYFYGEWGQFSNPAGIGDCIYNNLHTFVNAAGTVFQETPGVFADGTNTAYQMSFTTSWIKLAGLQGYQRAFFFYILAEYLSAHQLQVQISYDFNVNPLSGTPTIGIPAQTTIITPNGNSLENWRVFLAKQRCQAFQLTIQELSTVPGAALTISGLNLTVGVKSSFRTFSAAESVG